jgi:hypothetical protein
MDDLAELEKYILNVGTLPSSLKTGDILPCALKLGYLANGVFECTLKGLHEDIELYIFEKDLREKFDPVYKEVTNKIDELQRDKSELENKIKELRSKLCQSM